MRIPRATDGHERPWILVPLGAFAVVALLACGGSGPPKAATPGATSEGTGAAPTAPPTISHELVGKDDCLSCHVVGAKKPTGLAETHKGRENSTCRGCHQPGVAKAGS